MRKFAPALILIIGLFGLVLDFWPNLSLPSFDAAGGNRPIETKLGLDLQGGLRAEYQALPVGGKAPGPADLNTIRSIIERRVNSLGVSEAVVQTQGTDRIVVELPGVVDTEAVRKLVGATGLLEFTPLPAATYGTGTNPGSKQAIQGQPLPTTEQALFSGAEIESANPSTDSNGARAVAFTLKSNGAKLFGDYTAAHVGEFFAIVLDGSVVSAPVIQSAITGGSGIITGGTSGFTAAEMNNLVTVLKYGSLPFPIQELASANISATLGKDFLAQTLFGGGIGILLVLLFMLIYYRLPGLIADVALIYYALVVYAIFRFIPVTLTLAGIAGFVLSVGMAVDANILIFERTKEELRVGKSLTAAVEAGFSRAWNSILDSNVSSLITASILFWFGSSSIRGFALVLIIGVVTSMFTAITVTRTILRFVVRQDAVRKAGYFGVTEEEFSMLPPNARGRNAGVRNRV